MVMIGGDRREWPVLATGGSAQMRGFAIGVGSKADIGAPPLTQLSLGLGCLKFRADRAPLSAILGVAGTPGTSEIVKYCMAVWRAVCPPDKSVQAGAPECSKRQRTGRSGRRHGLRFRASRPFAGALWVS